MAKPKQTKDEKETFDYWIGTNDHTYNEVAAELYGVIHKSPKWSNPINAVATFQNLTIDLYNERGNPGRAFNAMDERFKIEEFTTIEKHGILACLKTYFDRKYFAQHFQPRPDLKPIYKLITTELDRLNAELKPNKKAKPSKYKLSQKTGAKINLIRVLNALHELQFFVKTDQSGTEQPPTKIEFMEDFGNSFGLDLSDYAGALSQSLKEQPLEVNLKVFEEMKAITQNQHYLTEKRKK